MREPIVRPIGHILLGTTLHLLATHGHTTPRGIEHRLRAGDPHLHARFRMTLARQIRMSLRRDIVSLRDLHVFGSTLGEAVRPTSDLDLLVHLARRDERIEAQLHELAEALGAEYRRLMAGRVPDDFDLVSLHVVTDDEVKAREGFAALITSLHAPTLRLDT